MMKRSLGQKKIFVAIFGTFGRYVTNLKGTFVENVKKVENQPTLMYSTCLHQSAFYLLCVTSDLEECSGLGSGQI
jgi:hypothetical protein